MDKYAQLEQAKSYFYSWRMPEAYAIFRRFFDRLPFEFDEKHAHYIGIYVRLLAEMGKERELAFYRPIIEKHYERSPSPHLAYSLVVLYLFDEPRRPELAKKLLETCLSQTKDPGLTTKAKLLLASFFDSEKGDIAACEAIVASIPELDDVHLNRMVEIWRAKLLADREKFQEAEALLRQLDQTVSWEEDWYTVFSARVVLGTLCIQQQRWEEARRLLTELKQRTADLRLKCVARQLAAIEDRLRDASQLGCCTVKRQNGEIAFRYRNKNLRVKQSSSLGRLLLLLLKQKRVAKEDIVKAIYSRDYSGDADDGLVYYQVHALRRQLAKTGLPAEAIQTTNGFYLWRPETKNDFETDNEEKQ